MNIATLPHRNADSAMSTLLHNIMDFGKTVSPRGKIVSEVLGAHVAFDMRFPLVLRPSRVLGYRFAPAEAAWILSGHNQVAHIKPFSRFIWQYSDDAVFYFGAYGPKIVDQLTYVVDALIKDTETRQAVINIWRENPRETRDVPCTLSYQFIAREGRLHCVQTMRSSDGWLGYPYDAFNATMLTGYVLLLLRARGLVTLGVGNHYMNIGSAHIYEPQWGKVQEFVDDTRSYFEPRAFDPLLQFDDPQGLINHLWLLAARKFESCESTYLVDGLREIAHTITQANEEQRA